MATFRITGGQKLNGDLYPQGAKNEALQVICAVLLTDEEVIISNVPNISDVNKLIEILIGLGVEVHQLEHGTFSFRAHNIDLDYMKTEHFAKQAARLRGSIMIIGPLLARYGVGYIPQPGGDKIGRRRLDTHFIGFLNLGAEFNFDSQNNFYKVQAPRLHGAYMLLDEASVTGTANIVMAAVMATGTT
ncbi:MAG: UDP-N-acetylglucosamine 1-carboxyvinyltransferase, partial [Bacteroidota bacterium]|nr:UDP-N-acetylglucosamine 1-carboxyvinyltransferase [Bacteroidota bacterium]